MASGMDEETAKKEAPSLKAAHDMLVKWELDEEEKGAKKTLTKRSANRYGALKTVSIMI